MNEPEPNVNRHFGSLFGGGEREMGMRDLDWSLLFQPSIEHERLPVGPSTAITFLEDFRAESANSDRLTKITTKLKYEVRINDNSQVKFVSTIIITIIY